MNLLDEYHAKHQHPINKVLHLVGIPAVVLSLPLFLFHWRWALAVFIAGWMCQLVGHAVEGKPPAFLKNPIYLLIRNPPETPA